MLGAVSKVDLDGVTNVLRGDTGNRVIDPAVSVAKVVMAYMATQKFLSSQPISRAYMAAWAAAGVYALDYSGKPDPYYGGFSGQRAPLYRSGLISLMAGVQMAALAMCLPHARSVWSTSKGMMAAAALPALELGLLKGSVAYTTAHQGWEDTRGDRKEQGEKTWTGQTDSGLVNLVVYAAQAALMVAGAQLLAGRIGLLKGGAAALTLGGVGLAARWASEKYLKPEDEYSPPPPSQRAVKALFPAGLLMGACGYAAWAMGLSTKQVWALRHTLESKALGLQLLAGSAATLLPMGFLGVLFDGHTNYGNAARLWQEPEPIEATWRGKSGCGVVNLVVAAAQAALAVKGAELLASRFGLTKGALAALACGTVGFLMRLDLDDDNHTAGTFDREFDTIAPHGIVIGACGVAAWMMARSTMQVWALRSEMGRGMLGLKLLGGVTTTALAACEAAYMSFRIGKTLPTDLDASADKVWTLQTKSRAFQLTMGLAQAYGMFVATQALATQYGAMKVATSAAALATFGVWLRKDHDEDFDTQLAFIAPRGLLVGLGAASAMLFWQQISMAKAMPTSFDKLMANPQLFGAGAGAVWAGLAGSYAGFQQLQDQPREQLVE